MGDDQSSKLLPRPEVESRVGQHSKPTATTPFPEQFRANRKAAAKEVLASPCGQMDRHCTAQTHLANRDQPSFGYEAHVAQAHFLRAVPEKRGREWGQLRRLRGHWYGQTQFE